MNNCAFIPRAIQENNDKALFESCVNLSSYFLFLSPFILERIVKTKTVSPRILCPNNRSFLASRMESEYRYIYIDFESVWRKERDVSWRMTKLKIKILLTGNVSFSSHA